MQGPLGRLQWESQQLTGPYFYGYSTHLLSNTVLPASRAVPHAEQPTGSRTGTGGQWIRCSMDSTSCVRGAAWAGVGPAAGEGARAVGFAWAPQCCAAAAEHLSCAESKAACTAPF